MFKITRKPGIILIPNYLAKPTHTRLLRPLLYHQRTFTMSQQPRNLKTSPLDPKDAKWIHLQQIQWTDQHGTERTWEVASRTKRNDIGIDAVAIAPILVYPNKPAATLIILQYRPPLNATCVEFPAGLIDAGESPEEAALRELKEETGYEGRVIDVLPTMANDPGMSSSNMQLAVVEVQLRDSDEPPEQHLEEGEAIEPVLVPLSKLYDRLLQYTNEGLVVDSRLFHWAHGVKFALQFDNRYQISSQAAEEFSGGLH